MCRRQLSLYANVRDLVELIGAMPAACLMEALGGVERQYIPKRFRPDHPIASIVGEANFVRLIDKFGGHHISIPLGSLLGKKKVAVIRAIDGGASTREAGLAAGCTGRYVRMVRNGIAPELKDHKSGP